MKSFIIKSVKAALVGSVTHKVLRTVLPKAVPGGVVALIAVEVAAKILKSKK